MNSKVEGVELQSKSKSHPVLCQQGYRVRLRIHIAGVAGSSPVPPTIPILSFGLQSGVDARDELGGAEFFGDLPRLIQILTREGRLPHRLM